MNNRLHNATNPWQGTDKRVLCVCSAGLLRSPTAANVLHKEFGFNTRAVGVDKGHALIVLDDVLLTWADEIVCMDFYQANLIFRMMEDLGLNKEVIVLEIQDNYAFMNEELQQLILDRYTESLGD